MTGDLRCRDCIFLSEKTGLLRSHAVCIQGSRRGRQRVSEDNRACGHFKPQMVKPGLSLVRTLEKGVRHSYDVLSSQAGEVEAPKADGGQQVDATDLDLAAPEARAAAAEARAQALEAKAALAEARARARRYNER